MVSGTMPSFLTRINIELEKLFWTDSQLQQGLGRYFPYYNGERLHQALGYRTPAAVYHEGRRQAG
jgi:hypothetical protein